MNQKVFGSILFIILGSGTVKSLEEGTYRVAILNKPCYEKGKKGWKYQSDKCIWVDNNFGNCACITSDPLPIKHEMNKAKLKQLRRLRPEQFVDVSVCRKGLHRWVQYSPHYCKEDMDCPGDSRCNTSNKCRPSRKWKCERIARGIPKTLISMSKVRSPLYLAMVKKCCASCAGECWITPTEWGECPYCLLFNTCSNYCSSVPVSL